MRKLLKIIPILSLIYLCCPKEPKEYCNPLDSSSECYEPPGVKIISAPADTTHSLTAIFKWRGDPSPYDLDVKEFEYEFRYKITGSVWSDWCKKEADTFRCAEGPCTFYIQSRYPTGDESDIYTHIFYVDSIREGVSACMINPLEVRTVRGDTFKVKVWLENVKRFKTGEVLIKHKEWITPLRIYPDTAGQSFLEQHSPYTVKLLPAFDSLYFRGDTLIGFNIAIIGDTLGITGSGGIVVIEFKAEASGEAPIDIFYTEFYYEPDWQIPDTSILKIDGIVRIQ